MLKLIILTSHKSKLKVEKQLHQSFLIYICMLLILVNDEVRLACSGYLLILTIFIVWDPTITSCSFLSVQSFPPVLKLTQPLIGIQHPFAIFFMIYKASVL